MKQISMVMFLALILGASFSTAINSDPGTAADLQKKSFDLQGHRGARGLFPENTIPAFLYALDIGVTTLEMDVVINAEGTVILSHEPWMSAAICSHPDGREISSSEQKELRIYAMTDEEVRSYDCGSRGNARFPGQQAMNVFKPSLDDVFLAVSQRSSESERKPVLFNIEIKSTAQGDDVYHPQVERYARLLYEVLERHDVLQRSSIQSFDPRALEAAHRIDPQVTLVLLVENNLGFQKNIDRLSFSPDIYSPNYNFVDQELVQAAHSRNIRVIPWTVNNKKAMRKLIAMGVDGMITDYPDRGLGVLAETQPE